MLKRIEPEAVICYCSVFPEMEGKIIEVGYAQTNHLKHKFLIEHSDINHAIIESNSWIGIQKRQSYYVKKNGFLITTGMGGGGVGRPDFPGWDPNIPPGKNFEWRGTGNPDSGKGSWYNPGTKEKLHPDLGHKEPYGPHWDYDYPGGGNGFRIFPDNTMSPKYYDMEEICYG